MAYSPGALEMLENWIGGLLPFGGSILELGCQDLNRDIPIEQICRILERIHGRPFSVQEAEEIVTDSNGARRLYYLFKNSPIECRYVDLYGDDWGIVADLNSYVVPEEYRNRFDLVTNLGTTEHIFNQNSVFKSIHDFTKTGGYIYHTVPFCGYYNHGLFNYHPIFFLFLANANKYKIIALNISAPHLSYTIPASAAIAGAENWSGQTIESGMLNCVLQKVEDGPFQTFTDFDRTSVKDPSAVLPELGEVLEWRYDLRIRK